MQIFLLSDAWSSTWTRVSRVAAGERTPKEEHVWPRRRPRYRSIFYTSPNPQIKLQRTIKRNCVNAQDTVLLDSVKPSVEKFGEIPNLDEGRVMEIAQHSESSFWILKSTI